MPSLLAAARVHAGAPHRASGNGMRLHIHSLSRFRLATQPCRQASGGESAPLPHTVVAHLFRRSGACAGSFVVHTVSAVRSPSGGLLMLEGARSVLRGVLWLQCRAGGASRLWLRHRSALRISSASRQCCQAPAADLTSALLFPLKRSSQARTWHGARRQNGTHRSRSQCEAFVLPGSKRCASLSHRLPHHAHAQPIGAGGGGRACATPNFRSRVSDPVQPSTGAEAWDRGKLVLLL